MTKDERWPTLWRLEDLLRTAAQVGASVDGKTYYPARPLGFMSIGNRIRCAWAVFTGRADAVIWPGGQ